MPLRPWNDVSMDFIVTPPSTQGGKDAIMVLADRFSKMAHYVSCHKTNDASYIAELYFKEIIRLYYVPKTIISDKDSKFICNFWRSL